MNEFDIAVGKNSHQGGRKVPALGQAVGAMLSFSACLILTCYGASLKRREQDVGLAVVPQMCSFAADDMLKGP
ncbi:Hypp8736 [Branchiostoma lanceolatum]|uniref:Hypp8736 protein n=1 Tax=Branchiostoma lanceolatum TaxID=7740 RepID=A0A8J9Z8W4_BRALA|nr:Hypp8736 [Branchiostoma lanceolatum]